MWIAFKNYYLRDTTQRLKALCQKCHCCELLSKIIIFVTRHNFRTRPFGLSSVVNCFQKLLSSWHDTTLLQKWKSANRLWIAFKNYYLRDTTQLRSVRTSQQFRCELLSKIIIFVTRHNETSTVEDYDAVVNCFQKLLSSWHDTTINWLYHLFHQLWIAFKNYYLRDTTQQSWDMEFNRIRCELLSKIIIFVTRHNSSSSLTFEPLVVNCFQKLLSSWHDTTK